MAERATAKPARWAALTLALAGCGSAAPPIPETAGFVTASSFVVVAEGPCPKLSIQAIGERRFLVHGDTGYDLQGWLPGDELTAAQSIVELRGGRAYRSPQLLAGLPTDGRGYVPGDVVLGGAFDRAAWLLRITSRYNPTGRGALFERDAEGYVMQGHRWARAKGGQPVELPEAAGKLPPLPRETMCERPGITFVPLASTSSPAGGVLVAGRCADRGPRNLADPTVLVAHGLPNATTWTVKAVPGAAWLDGIINLDLYARTDSDVVLVAYEPFQRPMERQRFMARYDGATWKELPLSIRDGLMSVTGTPDGALWFAGGRALYRVDALGRVAPVALPPLRFARGGAEGRHIHTVRSFGAEVWVEASYRVLLPEGSKEAPAWASALFANVRPPAHLIYCDARERAPLAVTEVE